jgi:N-acetylmuramoyl-L-alanine amidase
MRKIKWIVIHCTAGYGDVDSIKRYWKNVLGWKEVGYHFFIYRNGTVVQLADISKVTNGVKGFNSNSVHIAYQGGVELNNVNKAKDTRTPEQKQAILQTIKTIYDQLKFNQDVSDISIQGHRDFSPDKNGNGVVDPWERIKECPSFDAIPEYAWIKGPESLRQKGII